MTEKRKQLIGSIVTRPDGSRWRIIELNHTSDGYVLGTGILLTEEDDWAEHEDCPVVHSFFFGREP